MFYHINGRLPYTDRHLSVPDGETSLGIIGEELCLNCKIFARALQNVLGQVQAVLFHLHFLLPSLCFFARKETLAKNFLTELYKNLTVEVLSPDNSENLQFDVVTDLCIEMFARLENSIFANMKGIV